MAKLLLMHDPALHCDAVENVAAQDGHLLHHASSLEEVERSTYRNLPDLVIVDNSIAGTQAEQICKALRNLSRLERVPILALVNPTQPVAPLLDLGCDECMRTPVIDRELGARIRALLRRQSHSTPRAMLMLDYHQKRASLQGRMLELTPTEFDLLAALCHDPRQFLSPAQLLEQVWDYAPGRGDPALVRNHIRNLRRKLEANPDHPQVIVCLQGRGYTVSAEIRSV